MPWGAAAVVAGALISADAASSATDAQMAAGRESNSLQKQMFDLQRADLAPWRLSGEQALNRINALFGFNQYSGAAPNQSDFMKKSPAYKFTGEMIPDTQAYNEAMARYKAAPQGGAGYNAGQAGQDLLAMDPGYKFRMNEGNKALQNSLLARGGALSGAALKAGQSYSQGMASQEFGSAYNRLLGLANMGAGAAGQQAGFAGQYGMNVGNTLQGMGNAQAAGAIQQGNIWNNAINQGMSMYGQYGG